MQKNKLNLHICGIHLLIPYKTVVSHLKNLIVRVSDNKRAARAARTYEQVRAILCKITT